MAAPVPGRARIAVLANAALALILSAAILVVFGVFPSLLLGLF